MASAGPALDPSAAPNLVAAGVLSNPPAKPVSLSLQAARIGFLLLFAAVPVLAIKVGLTPWMLALALLCGLASVFFWAKLPS